MSYKVIDLFSGVGGMSLGFEEAGFEIVLAIEYDKEIAMSYEKNHPRTDILDSDITKLDLIKTFSRYRGIDIVIGGPPCQGFSQKGKRNILDDPRNYLFKNFFEVVKIVRPVYFVIENVPNILTAENGNFKMDIYKIFEGIGYTLNSEILNASDFGVPQNRKRAFIVGTLKGKPIAFPEKELNKVTIWDAISDLNFLSSGEGNDESSYKFEANTKYQEESRNNSKSLFNHRATKHSELALERLKLLPENGERSDLPAEHHTKSIHSGTWSRMKKESQSVTITTRFDTPSSGRFTHPSLNRAITVREAARLQSFPDNFRFYGSKTSQMKQVGNAVPPLLAQKIAESIRSDIENE